MLSPKVLIANVVMILLVLLSQSAMCEINILVFAQSSPHTEVNKLNTISGLSASGTTSVADINPVNLVNFDVFYAASVFKNLLDSKDSVLQNFLSSGGGIVVGQSNVEGIIDWLPERLEATVNSIWYPDRASFLVTSSGAIHPILDGLNISDLGTRPVDTILCNNLGTEWDVLMVHSSNSNILGLAAANYGSGRILLWPDRCSSGIYGPSDIFLKQMLEWVSTSEPVASIFVDIKPGSCPNPLNLKSSGVLPVAILGSEKFDVQTIDVASVRLEGVAAIRHSYEDVAAPVSDANDCNCTTEGPDGYIDLTLKFNTEDIVDHLIKEYDDLEKGQILNLEMKCELFDGWIKVGSDCVTLVGNVPQFMLARNSDINTDGVVDFLDLAKLAEYWLEYTVP
ncbi:MAG: hypothetical protein ACXADH_06800 [Candidatus Kariarchaeaceae archaeon]|jgi:hypothetical protein